MKLWHLKNFEILHQVNKQFETSYEEVYGKTRLF